MNDDRNEADRILGENWMMPGYRWFLEAWEKHPWHELLDERKGEVDEDGAGCRPRAPRGRLGRVPGYVPQIYVTGARASASAAWPEKAETDELAYAPGDGGRARRRAALTPRGARNNSP